MDFVYVETGLVNLVEKEISNRNYIKYCHPMHHFHFPIQGKMVQLFISG